MQAGSGTGGRSEESSGEQVVEERPDCRDRMMEVEERVELKMEELEDASETVGAELGMSSELPDPISSCSVPSGTSPASISAGTATLKNG